MNICEKEQWGFMAYSKFENYTIEELIDLARDDTESLAYELARYIENHMGMGDEDLSLDDDNKDELISLLRAENQALLDYKAQHALNEQSQSGQISGALRDEIVLSLANVIGKLTSNSPENMLK